MRDHKTKTLDPTFIGRVEKAGESTDNLSYIWRAGRVRELLFLISMWMIVIIMI